MAIRITQWQPDTCQCIFEYSWDDAVPDNERVHTPHRTVKKCAMHQAISDVVAHLAALEDTNKRKNKIYGYIADNIPEFTDSYVNEEGITIKNVKYTVTFSYSVSGVLTITVPGLTNPKKNAAQAWCDTNIGVGKVIIVN